MNRRLVLGGLLALLTGCTGAKFKPSAGAAKYPRFKGQVRVLERLPAAEDYESLGVVIVTGAEATRDESLRRRAIKEGSAPWRQCNCLAGRHQAGALPGRRDAEEARRLRAAIGHLKLGDRLPILGPPRS